MIARSGIFRNILILALVIVGLRFLPVLFKLWWLVLPALFVGYVVIKSKNRVAAPTPPPLRDVTPSAPDNHTENT